MTKQSIRTMKIVGLVLVVLVMVAFTPPMQDTRHRIQKAWERYSFETNNKNKLAEAKKAAPKPVAEKKKPQQPADLDVGAATVAQLEVNIDQLKKIEAEIQRNPVPPQQKQAPVVVSVLPKASAPVQKPSSVPAPVVVAKAAASAPKAATPIKDLAPKVATVPRASVQKPVRTARWTSPRTAQRPTIPPAWQNPPVTALRPKPELLQPEAFAQKIVPKVENPSPSRNPNWNAVCEDKSGLGIPPTAPCQ